MGLKTTRLLRKRSVRYEIIKWESWNEILGFTLHWDNPTERDLDILDPLNIAACTTDKVSLFWIISS